MFALVYLDDILIYTKETGTILGQKDLEKEHASPVKLVFQELIQFDFDMKLSKCEKTRCSKHILGHVSWLG